MTINGNILVITQWSFKDALVQAYTLPYVEIIRKMIPPDKKITLVTSEQQHIALKEEEQDAINAGWKEKNMQLVTQHYRKFGFGKLMGMVTQLIHLYRLTRKEKISIIHAFCTPAGGFGYLLSRLTGAKLVIDSYEPHAEAMVENGTWKKKSFAFKILFALEKRQTRHASVLIATTEGMKQYALEKYGAVVNNFFVKPACVDTVMFSLREKDTLLAEDLQLENKIVGLYAGKLGGIYFKEEVFDFIKACYDHWKDRFRFLLLSNAAKEEIDAEIIRVGLPDNIVISRFVFHGEIPRYLSLGDFAINPVKPVPTKRYCTSIKDGEYWAMGLPVLISPGISDDSDIIKENEQSGVVVDLRQREKYNEAILKLNQILLNGSRRERSEKIFLLAKQYRNFEIAENIYRNIYSKF